MFKTAFASMVIALVLAACAPAATLSPTGAPQPPATAAESPSAKSGIETAAQPAAPSPQASAENVAEFYRGRTVKIIVGFAPGGGFDLYSRTIGRFLGQHIPGGPSVVIENMEGAGSRLAANHVYNVAPKDGTTIGSIQGRLLAQQYLGGQGIEFDAPKFHYLGAPAADNTVCAVTKQSGFSSLAEAIGPNARELILGGDAPGTGTHDTPLMLRDVLGARIKLVPGYAGTAPVRLAAEKGEVHGLCTSWESLRTSIGEDVRRGDWVVIGRVNERPIEELPNVPSVLDLAPTEEARQLLRYGIAVPNNFSRPYVLPPEVPSERVHALRQAFMATMQDPAFLAAAEQAKLDIAPLTGEEVQRQVADFASIPESLRAKLQQVLQARA